MKETYDLKDLALMTGFTTRTLRNYLNQGILKGEKIEGNWRFTPEETDAFFREPFVKEGLRIKRNGAVFDFMAEKRKDGPRTLTVLDLPASLSEAERISAFFCEQMKTVRDAQFRFSWEQGFCRVILSGSAEAVAALTQAYETEFRA